jgi:hypothetical protein
MSTPYTLKRNAYIKENASCKDCDIKSCASRAHLCPYFLPKEGFVLKMLKDLGLKVLKTRSRFGFRKDSK